MILLKSVLPSILVYVLSSVKSPQYLGLNGIHYAWKGKMEGWGRNLIYPYLINGLEGVGGKGEFLV